MTRRPHAVLALALGVACVVAACGGTTSGPALTDPKEILTAALTATDAATSVHVEVAVDGTATVALPVAGSTGAPIDLSGTTASADIDLVASAARATFAAPNLLGLAGNAIVVDGVTYVKTTLTGKQYQVVDRSSLPVDPTKVRTIVDDLGQLLSKPGVVLVKGDDVACGSKTCYTVSADLTAEQLGSAAGSGAGAPAFPVDLAGATLKLTLRVEQDLPHYLAGLSATLEMPNGSSVRVELTCSKWDAPVSIAAPPADQVKPS
jgi:hypothetical protein